MINWQYSLDPYVKINSYDKPGNFSECEGNMTLDNWEKLIRWSDADYSRTIIVIEFGNPLEYLKVKYKLPSCKYPCNYLVELQWNWKTLGLTPGINGTLI